MDAFLQAWQSFADKVISMLPQSPTIDNAALQTFARYAGYVNYFIPVGPYLTFLSGLLAVVAIYYVTMVILRWIKVIP